MSPHKCNFVLFGFVIAVAIAIIVTHNYTFTKTCNTRHGKTTANELALDIDETTEVRDTPIYEHYYYLSNYIYTVFALCITCAWKASLLALMSICGTRDVLFLIRTTTLPSVVDSVYESLLTVYRLQAGK